MLSFFVIFDFAHSLRVGGKLKGYTKANRLSVNVSERGRSTGVGVRDFSFTSSVVELPWEAWGVLCTADFSGTTGIHMA